MEILEADIDLEDTLECGQTFQWKKIDGSYFTTINGNCVQVTECETGVKHNSENINKLKKRLGLHYNLEDVQSQLKEYSELNKAIEQYPNLRLIQDSVFPCVISFITSIQNNIPRIHNLLWDLRAQYGKTTQYNSINSFPSPEDIQSLNEQDLRNIGFGYRAPYIIETAEKFRDLDIESIKHKKYEEAHEKLKKLTGVGNKVSDCILLYSLRFTEAVPLDTWMKTIIEKHYPQLLSDDYKTTSKNFRTKFGEDSGFAQLYLYHHERQK